MALNKQALEDKISALLALDAPPNAVDPADCANKISDYIDEYLADIELNAFPAPGVNPTGASGGPLPDPVGPAPKADPEELLVAAQFRAELVLMMTGDPITLSAGDFSTCGPKFAADMAILAKVVDAQSYEAEGATVCGTHPDIDFAFAKGKVNEVEVDDEGNITKKTHEVVAAEIANQIHIATTYTIFTASGPYKKELFEQTPPAPPYISPFK